MLLPSEGNWDDTGAVLGNLQESGLSHVKVLEGRIAPTAVVVRQGKVRWAEVGGGDNDGAGEAPLGVIFTFHFIA